MVPKGREIVLGIGKGENGICSPPFELPCGFLALVACKQFGGGQVVKVVAVLHGFVEAGG